MEKDRPDGKLKYQYLELSSSLCRVLGESPTLLQFSNHRYTVSGRHNIQMQLHLRHKYTSHWHGGRGVQAGEVLAYYPAALYESQPFQGWGWNSTSISANSSFPFQSLGVTLQCQDLGRWSEGEAEKEFKQGMRESPGVRDPFPDLNLNFMR